VAAINRLVERTVPVIHAHGGRVDKFVGDRLLAVVGAPRRQPDHADEALSAALEIADAVGSGAAGQLEIGIGLNSGDVVAGNIGGDRRFEFSVIGDAVNVAARVEAATRRTGDTDLLTERTAALLSREVELEGRPPMELKGKRDAVPVYAPKVRAADASASPGNAPTAPRGRS
jgi:adenylate cyclase